MSEKANLLILDRVPPNFNDKVSESGQDMTKSTDIWAEGGDLP